MKLKRLLLLILIAALPGQTMLSWPSVFARKKAPQESSNNPKKISKKDAALIITGCALIAGTGFTTFFFWIRNKKQPKKNIHHQTTFSINPHNSEQRKQKAQQLLQESAKRRQEFIEQRDKQKQSSRPAEQELISAPNPELFDAVKKGDIAAIEKMAKAGIDINQEATKGTQKRTPLIEAICAGKNDIVKKLLELGADPERFTSNGNSPLLISMWENPQIAPLLIERFNKVNTVDPFYQTTPLALAAFFGAHESVKLLIKKGADVNQIIYRDRSSTTALNEALDSSVTTSEPDDSIDYDKTIALLENAGAKLSFYDQIRRAARNRNNIPKIKQLFADHKQEINNKKINLELIAFHLYGIENAETQKKIFNLLVKYGFNLNAQTIYADNLPLLHDLIISHHEYASPSKIKFLDLLLDAGVDIAVSSNAMMAVHYHAEQKKPEKLTHPTQSTIQIAAILNLPDIVEKLLAKGARITDLDLPEIKTMKFNATLAQHPQFYAWCAANDLLAA